MSNVKEDKNNIETTSRSSDDNVLPCFYTQYYRPGVVFSEPGRMIIDEYGLKVDKETGKSELVITGQTDFYSMIQTDKDLCDIEKIVKRFENGEVDVLDKRQGVYFDATDMPQTYAEMQERIIECNRIFDNLPVDVKEQFNNSPGEFWQVYGSKEWQEKMGFNKTPESSDVEPVVKDDAVEKHIENVDDGGDE